MTVRCYLCIINFRITHFPIKIVSKVGKKLTPIYVINGEQTFSWCFFMRHKTFNLQMDGQIQDKFVVKCHANAFHCCFIKQNLSVHASEVENGLILIFFGCLFVILYIRVNFTTSNRWKMLHLLQFDFLTFEFGQTNQSIFKKLIRFSSPSSSSSSTSSFEIVSFI